MTEQNHGDPDAGTAPSGDPRQERQSSPEDPVQDAGPQPLERCAAAEAEDTGASQGASPSQPGMSEGAQAGAEAEAEDTGTSQGASPSQPGMGEGAQAGAEAEAEDEVRAGGDSPAAPSLEALARSIIDLWQDQHRLGKEPDTLVHQLAMMGAAGLRSLGDGLGFLAAMAECVADRSTGDAGAVPEGECERGDDALASGGRVRGARGKRVREGDAPRAPSDGILSVSGERRLAELTARLDRLEARVTACERDRQVPARLDRSRTGEPAAQRRRWVDSSTPRSQHGTYRQARGAASNERGYGDDTPGDGRQGKPWRPVRTKGPPKGPPKGKVRVQRARSGEPPHSGRRVPADGADRRPKA